MDWMEALTREVKAKSVSQVAREIGLSKTTISLVCNGKYGASTDSIERKVMNLYGDEGAVDCPALGRITALECSDNHQRAKVIGGRATGNPRSLRFYHECKKCSKRG